MLTRTLSNITTLTNKQGFFSELKVEIEIIQPFLFSELLQHVMEDF